MALPWGFAEYLCLELEIVHQVRITFKNPETSLFGWQLFTAAMVVSWKEQERAEHSVCFYQGEELGEKA